MPKFEVGQYAMKGGGCVRIADVRENPERGTIYSINYMQNRADEPITRPFGNGGSSFWWDEKEIAPLADPILVLRARLTTASNELQAAVDAGKAAGATIEHLTVALAAIAEATAAPKLPTVEPRDHEAKVSDVAVDGCEGKGAGDRPGGHLDGGGRAVGAPSASPSNPRVAKRKKVA